MNYDRTIRQTVLTNGKPANVIYVYPDARKTGKPVQVVVLSRRKQLKCEHQFCTVSYIWRGHGGWRCGCRLCGALSR